MPYEPKYLKRWKMPSFYFGEVWPAYYGSGFGRSRDSDSLWESNFQTALKALGGESETVTVVREGHWAVGWFEWIAIHQDDEKALRIADDLCEQVEDYPALDEDDWYNREYEAASTYWEGLSVPERVDLCREYGISIFAARHDCLPEDDNGSLFEVLRG